MTKRTIGTALVVVGLVMLFRMARVYSFGFYRIGHVSTSAIVLVLLLLSAIAVVAKRNKFTIACLVISLALLVLSLILGTSIYFVHASLLDIMLVFIPVVLGLGIIIQSFLPQKNH